MKTEKDTSVIPKGHYCYTPKMKDGKIVRTKSGGMKINICPYWSIRRDKPEQENGYCSFLEQGDWNINDEAILTDMKTGEKVNARDVPFGIGLLWDQCKECGENEE